MALIHCEFYSHALGRNTSAYVILPEYRDMKNKEEKLKTLYLFHGLGDNYTKWVRRSSIEKCAAADDWAVVMPDAEKSYYANTLYGDRYWDYIGEELPYLIQKNFPLLSDRREDRFVAGLSMGGYGAMKMALNYPERFCAAASFSGALNLEKEMQEEAALGKRLFGSAETIRGTENDLFYQARKRREEGKVFPRLYLSCGTEDPIYPQSQDFRRVLDELGIPYTYEEWSGKHDWVFWEESMKHALPWFLKKDEM